MGGRPGRISAPVLATSVRPGHRTDGEYGRRKGLTLSTGKVVGGQQCLVSHARLAPTAGAALIWRIRWPGPTGIRTPGPPDRSARVLWAMTAVTRAVEWMPVAAARLDPESAEWLRVLGQSGQQREAALARLHVGPVRFRARQAIRTAGRNWTASCRPPRATSAAPKRWKYCTSMSTCGLGRPGRAAVPGHRRAPARGRPVR
jgi:hypothetical protein